MEKSELKRKMREYKQLYLQLCEAIREAEDLDDLDGFCTRTRKLKSEIEPYFHKLFTNPELQLFVKRALETDSMVTIGTVRVSEGDSDILNDIIHCYDELVLIDDAVTSGELHYLWHIETYQFSGMPAFQMYLGTTALHKEWESQRQKLALAEETKQRYIAPEVQYAFEFLEKHQDNDDLTELWSSSC